MAPYMIRAEALGATLLKIAAGGRWVLLNVEKQD